MRFLGWAFTALLVLFSFGFFLHWTDVKREDGHVEFHVCAAKIGNDLRECYEWCGEQCKRFNK